MSDGYDEDSWWSEECVDEAHAGCDLRGCDCSCHYPAPGIHQTAPGAYRLSAPVSPTTGLYVTDSGGTQ